LTIAQALTIIVVAGGGVLSVVRSAFTDQQPRIIRALLALTAAIAALLLSFGAIYQTTGLVDGGRPTTDFGTALYFSIVTWTTLGYGDVQPVGLSRAFSAVEALLGYIYLGLLVSVVVKVVTSSKE
jgi:hypothetical protein